MLWWARALGADFGGNLTAVRASANVVMLGIARRADNPISFWEFTRKGAVVTVMSIALGAIYLWLRYFVLGWEGVPNVDRANHRANHQSDRDIVSPRWPHHQRLTQMRDFYAFLLSEIPALLNRWYHQSLAPS
ncbi:hypothetical protein ACVWWN_002475 [Mycobacterium sp. URHB0021]